LTGLDDLRRDLRARALGCGAKNVEPGVIERRKIRFNETGLVSRRIELGDDEDIEEAMFARGWSDGLPLTRRPRSASCMLDGTSRDPQAVIGLVPPALAPATVEKIAINAVMAGSSPEYLAVMVAAVDGPARMRVRSTTGWRRAARSWFPSSRAQNWPFFSR